MPPRARRKHCGVVGVAGLEEEEEGAKAGIIIFSVFNFKHVVSYDEVTCGTYVVEKHILKISIFNLQCARCSCELLATLRTLNPQSPNHRMLCKMSLRLLLAM